MFAHNLCHRNATCGLVQRHIYWFVETAASPLVDATFLDGAVVGQMLNPGTDKTILEYA